MSTEEKYQTRFLSERRMVYVAGAVLAAAAAACYANSLANGFVFDDHELLARPMLRRLAALPGLLFESYRPLRDVSYAIDFAVWGNQPFGFHLTNVLIHAANTLLVFGLARQVTREYVYAGIASLLFALHPMQPDSVSYVAGRRDLLFAFFYLAGFHFYLAYRRHTAMRGGAGYRKRRAVLLYMSFAAAWLLGLMSKEMAVTLPLFIFAWSFCEAWDNTASSWARRFGKALRSAIARDKWLYMALSIAAPAFAAYSVFISKGSVRARGLEFSYWGGGFYSNMLTAIRVHAWYLKQLVFPTPVVQYFGAFDVSTAFDARVAVALLAVSCVLAMGFALLTWDKRLSFAVFSYFLLLLPVSQIIPHHELLADHYLYLPLMSFGVFIAVLAERLSRRGKVLKLVTVSAALVLVSVLAALTFGRNRVYKDDLSLWTAAYAEAPKSTRAVFNLAGQYAQSYPAKAADLYERCIVLDPSYVAAYLNLAALYQTKEKGRRVEELVQQGLALPESVIIGVEGNDPLRFRAGLTTALALAKSAQGDHYAAEQLLLQAIDIYPFLTEPYDLLANRYHRTDRAKEIAILRKEVEANPSALQAAQYLAQRLLEDKRNDEAEAYLTEIVAKWPNDFFANFQLAKINQSRNDCAQAMKYLIKAQSEAEAPDDVKTVELTLKGLAQQCK